MCQTSVFTCYQIMFCIKANNLNTFHDKKGEKKTFLTKSYAVTNIRKAFLLANLVLSVVFPVTLMVFVYALGALVKKMANGLMESSQILLLCD